METTLLMIDWELLSGLSYQTKLGKSLKNTLRKFNKEELFNELDDMISYFTDVEMPYECRVKSLHSCNLKYEKYYPSVEAEKVFNDVLSIRIEIDDYSIFDKVVLSEVEGVRIVDMRNGKSNDDGYRGIHMYFQKDHMHYPIEIQFVTSYDRQFNEWLHIYLYKYTDNMGIGAKLRTLYENGIIDSKEQFRREMQRLCVI